MITFYVDGEDGFVLQSQVSSYSIEQNNTEHLCNMTLYCLPNELRNIIVYASKYDCMYIELSAPLSKKDSVMYFFGCCIKNIRQIYPLILENSNELILEKVQVELVFVFEGLQTFQ